MYTHIRLHVYTLLTSTSYGCSQECTSLHEYNKTSVSISINYQPSGNRERSEPQNSNRYLASIEFTRRFRFLKKPMNSRLGCTKDNESILNLEFFPPELLAHILSFVPPHDLVHNCRLVCQNWNHLITDNKSDVWKRLIQLHSNSNSLSQLNDIQRVRLKLPWYVCYQICLADPFEKNLLRNNCGRWVPEYYPELFESQYEHWEVLLSDKLHCLVLRYPHGYHPFPQSDDVDLNPIYRTSFYTSTELKKQQTVDLCEHGLSRLIMDEVQPKIIASEWFSGNENEEFVADCVSEYVLKVLLLSSDCQSIIQQKEVSSSADDWKEDEWKQVTLEFENYGPGVRYVVFCHYAKDGQFQGEGTTMAGGIVKLALPILPDSSTVKVSSDV